MKILHVFLLLLGKFFPLTLSSGSPYEVFAGRDASRALATFSLDGSAMRDEYDDLSDLRSDQMTGLKEWELQFAGKYARGFLEIHICRNDHNFNS